MQPEGSKVQEQNTKYYFHWTAHFGFLFAGFYIILQIIYSCNYSSNLIVAVIMSDLSLHIIMFLCYGCKGSKAQEELKPTSDPSDIKWTEKEWAQFICICIGLFIYSTFCWFKCTLTLKIIPERWKGDPSGYYFIGFVLNSIGAIILIIAEGILNQTNGWKTLQIVSFCSAFGVVIWTVFQILVWYCILKKQSEKAPVSIETQKQIKEGK